MPKQRISRMTPKKRGRLTSPRGSTRQAGGQALIEYVLIITLVTLALIAVLAITGPAVGNVFSNQVYNLLGGNIEPRDTLSANDFWTQVAAVASYTPESPGLVTNTPAPATSTPTTGPSMTPSPMTPSPTPSHTPTPGPSPTPLPRDFGYPFTDDGTKGDWWKRDFDGVIHTTWNAEYWNYATYGWKNDMSSMAPGSGVYRTTVDSLDFYLATGAKPASSVSENFYARYTTTVSLEAKKYTFKIMRNNGIRIWVGGQIVVDENVPNAGDPKTWTQWATDPYQDKWFERSFTATAGSTEIKVEFVDDTGYAHLHVFLTDDGQLDVGDCTWAISNEAFRSAPTAWSDSPGKYYQPLSYCILSLRGQIDLRGSTSPKLEFWDRYNLQSGTYAKVGVSIAGTGNWVDTDVHYYETNLGWTRQTYDLTQFGSAKQDFRNQLIEIRFVLDARNSSNSYDGWWIDDITVTEDIKRQYTVGFSDNMEGESHWYPGGTWARSNEYAHMGSSAWSDSPGGNYVHGSNNILELDGIIVLDNTKLIGNPVVDPEVVFWHRYNLTYNDKIYVEVSSDDRSTWTPLGGAPLADTSTNLGWSQEVFSLASYIGKSIYLRFRIDARSDTSVADGWWIDDFSLRNKPNSTVQLEWCDNMEAGSAEWIPAGTWALVNGPDFNPDQATPHTVIPHSGSMYWSDSPRANYQHNTNSSLTLKSKVSLVGAVAPELVFWHLWDVEYSDDLYVEVSTDEGMSWVSVWQYDYGRMPPGYGSALVNAGYDHNFSWTREPVSLESYIGQTINVRFRIDALYSATVDDGWWIDDVCFQERNEIVRTLPFSDNVEAGPENWYLGGTWAAGTENRHGGTLAFSDSYGRPYEHETNAILELKGIVNLTGKVKPTLYYWDAFNLNYDDYALVEVRETDAKGKPLGNWQELARQRYTTTTSWDRRQVNLIPFINKYIKIRFRLYAAKDSRVFEGWWLDDISIVDRNGIEQVHSLPFTEDAEAVNPYWVYDGTWARIPSSRPIGSGNGLGPGGWTGEYYDDKNRNRAFDSGELAGTQTDTEINFNWGSYIKPPFVAGTDYYLIRWTRVITVGDTMKLTVQTQSDDGIRVFVDGQPMLNHSVTWKDRSYSSTPDTGPIFTLLEGDHTLVVEYYERTNTSAVFVNFAVEGYLFTDSPGGNYFHQNDMSLHLEGTIDLTGTTNPALSYWDARYLHSSDKIYVEVSTDEGFTWTSIRSTSGTDKTWKKQLHDLSAYKGKKITIRFRLDARTDSQVDDGWYIDDIVVAE